MATSKINTIRAALANQMSGTGWAVRRHNPGDSTGSRYVVYLAEADSTQDYLALDGSRWEQITFSGVARYAEPGAGDTEADTAEAACLAIIADIETAVRADVTLAGAATQVEFTGPLASEVVAADNMRLAIATFEVVARVAL